jgi:hypothetical protein
MQKTRVRRGFSLVAPTGFEPAENRIVPSVWWCSVWSHEENGLSSAVQ